MKSPLATEVGFNLPEQSRPDRVGYMVQRQPRSRVGKLVLARVRGAPDPSALGPTFLPAASMLRLHWQLARCAAHQRFLETFVRSVDPAPEISILQAGARELAFLPDHPQEGGGEN